MSKANRGFASMDKDKVKQIAGMGGKAAHAKGTAHQWNPKEAAAAGRKGGIASRGGRGKVDAPPVGQEEQ